MCFAAYRENGIGSSAAARAESSFRVCAIRNVRYASYLGHLCSGDNERGLAAGRALQEGEEIDFDPVVPLRAPPGIFCIGLAYAERCPERAFAVPGYSAAFSHTGLSFVGEGAAVVRARVPQRLEFEGEFSAFIGCGDREIGKVRPREQVIAYSFFSDPSIRDCQPEPQQWTVGKDADHTGALGAFPVAAEEIPRGRRGLRPQIPPNRNVERSAATHGRVVGIAIPASTLSEAVALKPGDIIVARTPAGVGPAHRPPTRVKRRMLPAHKRTIRRNGQDGSRDCAMLSPRWCAAPSQQTTWRPSHAMARERIGLDNAMPDSALLRQLAGKAGATAFPQMPFELARGDSLPGQCFPPITYSVRNMQCSVFRPSKSRVSTIAGLAT
ncbi:fumarylacetoacetate hydrolase family protein [Paraburkholderia sediminicola]|uniref:fumarylacetoacetate hydrolase family protein n=1 Tax=Paraburkholderia sediminicola TaxID=458836 RepID=UPI0038BDA411